LQTLNYKAKECLGESHSVAINKKN